MELLLVYRLIKERFLSTPLSAEGARRLSGRWNPPGIGFLYTSASPELALLEQMVHLRSLPYQDLPELVLLTLSFLSDLDSSKPRNYPNPGETKPILASIINCCRVGLLSRMCYR